MQIYNFQEVEICKLWFTKDYIDIHVTITGGSSRLFLKPLNCNGSTCEVNFILVQCSLALDFCQPVNQGGITIVRSIVKLVSC
jgi:hypothetical protein